MEGCGTLTLMAINALVPFVTVSVVNVVFSVLMLMFLSVVLARTMVEMNRGGGQPFFYCPLTC